MPSLWIRLYESSRQTTSRETRTLKKVRYAIDYGDEFTPCNHLEDVGLRRHGIGVWYNQLIEPADIDPYAPFALSIRRRPPDHKGGIQKGRSV
jgi:hypothetical protein